MMPSLWLIGIDTVFVHIRKSRNIINIIWRLKHVTDNFFGARYKIFNLLLGILESVLAD